MKDICSDVLIGHDILNRHSSVEIGFDGNRPPLTICSLAVAQVPPVSLFSNLNPDCRPLVTKSRRQTVEDNMASGKWYVNYGVPVPKWDVPPHQNFKIKSRINGVA
ncbi:putative retrovirus-related pol polyprotein from transposon opus [Trichonephila clavipes]|nr:putative retrovirus-related pol polyprotein from transposon opus [Trichonephila clavipes]